MEPDYSRYSIRDLREALESIDKEAYPERTKLIQQQLSQRNNSETFNTQTDANKLEKEVSPTSQFLLIIIALFFTWLAFNAVYSGTISGRRGNSYSYHSSPNMFLFLLGVDLFVIGYCLYALIKARSSSKK
ncbi:hypothetical protein BK026_17070 [Alteromonas sp. V450]|nr:hypothetical protein BK026_17070 [Alteromonas sp. V450]